MDSHLILLGLAVETVMLDQPLDPVLGHLRAVLSVWALRRYCDRTCCAVALLSQPGCAILEFVEMK